MSTTPPALSFTRASYEGDPPQGDACAFCKRPLDGGYYRVNELLACEACARQAATLVPPDSHAAFVRAVSLGAVAAVLGCAAYAIFQIATGIMIGYVAIAVGYLVGWAMRKGSHGLGGRRYQIAAALLTYAAVAVAFVPVAIHELREERAGVQAHATTSNQQGASASEGDGAPKAKPPATIGGWIGGIAMLLGLGLISPFLELASSVPHGLLNLFIIFLGIRMAWQHMAGRRLLVEGPYGAPGQT
ncbi:hypothetical protein SAMN05421819_2101 [Bryocella elongata]|uniref:Uncharacterized protein n=1 Tax=Bryocella elongata TaxID=863522 RepID=A0A1H5Y3C9_9BACT|nr:hypothetical protein [Bryocella elongata]SEG18491.1 hypothetical protein SAMN05421819_2101 [Bryocella elongata]